MKIAWLLIIALVSSYMCETYKILVIFPLPSKSHGILGNGYVKHLLEAGHEVTYITPFITNSTNPKFRQIDVSDNLKLFPEQTFHLKNILNKDVDLTNLKELLGQLINLIGKTHYNENVQTLLNDTNEQFDVIISEWMFSETVAGFAAVFDCPLIWSSSVEPHAMILNLIDENTNPAYTANMKSSNTTPFSFTQRVEELISLLADMIFKHFVLDVSNSEIYDKVFVPILEKRQRYVPSFDEVRYNASFVLGNSHSSLGEPTRLPQNYIGIAGYHIDTKVKPLPEDLKKIMDNAIDGVIYFSMGSNLKSTQLPDEIKRGLLKVFGGLKQTVLWKFEEVLPDLPKNVHIMEWAPQPSILSHPNCRLFITHGGLLSTTETIHFGVPIIGIPAFADQFINVARAVRKGFAKKVDLSYNLADDLKVAIEEVLNNPRYKDKAKELSAIYHDRPVPPGKELVHWVEHVVRTRGAPHLRSPALHVPWYQKAYLDLAAVILAVLVALKVAIKRLLCRSKKVDSAKKRK